VKSKPDIDAFRENLSQVLKWLENLVDPKDSVGALLKEETLKMLEPDNSLGKRQKKSSEGSDWKVILFFAQHVSDDCFDFERFFILSIQAISLVWTEHHRVMQNLFFKLAAWALIREFQQ
jgi:hypothetical protein